MVSIIIPFYNEEENLPVLMEELVDNLKGVEYELIFVDDGSTDKSILKIKNKISKTQIKNKIKIVSHRKRKGKGAALKSGFEASEAETIVFMDGDLQDNPADIKKFLKKIDEGYGLVNGWRKVRKDDISKTLPSSIFNSLLLRLFLRSKFHDINCGFKALRRAILEEIPLYGDNYRFLPILVENQGFKTAEVIVSHRPRMYGKSKYGTARLFFGLLDTATAYFIHKFAEKPLHFFGLIGGFLFSAGFLISAILAIERLFFGVLLYRRPALFLGILLIIVGVQIVMTGIVAELLVYLNKKKEK